MKILHSVLTGSFLCFSAYSAPMTFTPSPCELLPIADYKTPFCQKQFVSVLLNTRGVFNTTNQNVRPNQALGGMFAFYQNQFGLGNVCYISCGKTALNGSKPDQHTMFELASVSKTFTTAILGKLIWEGKVLPNSAISPFLPTKAWNGRRYELNSKEAPVTFQQLATFSGGFCYSDAPSVNINMKDPLIKQSLFVKNINATNPAASTCLAGGPPTPPVYGAPYYLPTQFFYSNSSVGLLAQGLMNIDGYPNVFQPQLNGWICDNITRVLDMPRTSACLPEEAKAGICKSDTLPGGKSCKRKLWVSNNYASGYAVSKGRFVFKKPFPWTPWGGAGALRSNAHDMISFLRAAMGYPTTSNPDELALIHGFQQALKPALNLPAPRGTIPLVANGQQLPLVGWQAYAWVCQLYGNYSICGKIGGHSGFSSFVGFSKEKDIGIVILFNTGQPAGPDHIPIPFPPSTASIAARIIQQY